VLPNQPTAYTMLKAWL